MSPRPQPRILLAILVALSGCGGGGDDGALPQDYAPAFVGRWSGEVSSIVDGQDAGAEPAETTVTSDRSNHLVLSGVCPDGAAVGATVRSPRTLSVDRITCPTVALPGCDEVTVRIDGGPGVLAAEVLVVAIQGTMSGCGEAIGVELVFSGARVEPTPVIAAIAPTTAAAGSTDLALTVTGQGFLPGATVLFGAIPIATTWRSGAELGAVVPEGLLADGAVVAVVVANPSGVASAAATFEIRNPPPVISGVVHGPLWGGAPGATLFVDGSGFVPSSAGRWNGGPRETTFRSSTRVEVALTAADLDVPGAGALTVLNPAPGGGESAPAAVTVENPPPLLAAVGPAAVAPGSPRFTLTVTGTGFSPGSVVRWSGAALPTTFVHRALLRAAVAPPLVAAAGAAAVDVVTPPPGGGQTFAAAFAIQAPPARTAAVAYQIGPGHDGRAALAAPLALPAAVPPATSPAPAWSVALPDLVSYPLVAEARAYVAVRGSASGQYGTRLYALDLATGAVAWGPVAVDGTYYWAGLAYDAGRIYVVNVDGVLRAFDAATGALDFTATPPGVGFVDATPSATAGVVYLGGSQVMALDGADGTVRWSTPVWGGDQASPAVIADGLLVAYPCQAYKLDLLTGGVLWHRAGPCSGGGGKTVAAGAAAAYVRDPTDLDPVGLVVDAFDGAALGTFGVGRATMPIPAVGAGRLFALSGGVLRAHDPLGAGTDWTFTGDGELVTAPILLDDGAAPAVVVGSAAGTVWALDAASGAERWRAEAGASILGPDEQNVSQPLTGLAAGEGYLLVPAGARLTAWRISGP